MSSQPDLLQSKIGTVLESLEPRDAVHIAVFAAPLGVPHSYAGTYVALVGEVLVPCLVENAIGIIDPFIKRRVYQDEVVLVFIMPNTITGLRHVYQHPMLDGVPEPRSLKSEVDWVTTFATTMNCTYTEFMEMADAYVDHGDCVTLGVELGAAFYEGDWPGFWERYDRITGLESGKSGLDDAFFNCAC